jgi:hypothetical protein
MIKVDYINSAYNQINTIVLVRREYIFTLFTYIIHSCGDPHSINNNKFLFKKIK